MTSLIDETALDETALRDEHWSDKCPDCDGRMSFTGLTKHGAHYWCPACEEEHVIPPLDPVKTAADCSAVQSVM